MLYRFATFELDTSKAELRENGAPRPVEPQVFALLTLLVENRERLVSRDEILDKIWDGRIVSDAALASRIKSARQALGDDGQSQRFIRTIHGQGFRFVAEVKVARAIQLIDPPPLELHTAHQAAESTRPSIAAALPSAPSRAPRRPPAAPPPPPPPTSPTNSPGSTARRKGASPRNRRARSATRWCALPS